MDKQQKPDVIYVESSERNDTEISTYVAKHPVAGQKEDGGYNIMLHRGNTAEWTEHCRGELVAALEDHGNGLVIDLADGENRLELDYCQMIETYIILHHFLRSPVIRNEAQCGKTMLKSYVEIEE